MLLKIVEELEDRFGEQIDDILSTVRASLVDPASNTEGVVPATEYAVQEQMTYAEEDVVYTEGAEGWEQDTDEVLFDDTGEGMGVEGDLDVEED